MKEYANFRTRKFLPTPIQPKIITDYLPAGHFFPYARKRTESTNHTTDRPCPTTAPPPDTRRGMSVMGAWVMQ